MVVFMHDAGAVSSETKYTLSQGNGAKVQRMTVDAEQNQDQVNKEVQSKIEEGYNIIIQFTKMGITVILGNMHMI